MTPPLRLSVCRRRGCGMLTTSVYCSEPCEWDAKDDPVLTLLEWGCKVGIYVISGMAGFLVAYQTGRKLGWWG